MTHTNNPLFTAIDRLDLAHEQVAVLKSQGIVTVGQLYDRAIAQPHGLQALLGVTTEALRDLIEQRWPQLARSAEAMRSAKPWPSAVAGLPDSADDFPEIAHWRAQRATVSDELASRIRQLRRKRALPTRVSHVEYLPQPYDQGPHGYCVGFGSTGTRDYLAQRWMSNGYAYRGAKYLDGRPDVEGSFQAFALEFFYRHGHVPDALYSYQDAIDDRSVTPLFKKAAEWKIAGYVDLLPEDDYAIVPDLMRGILSGRLVEDLGPRNIAVSLALYQSFNSYTTQRTGLVSLPGTDEPRSGGHAMNIVGYLDANDPNGLYDTDWFIVRNSWGLQWAAENPLGLPGHALIPAAYFSRPEWLWELLICIAEPPPRPALGWLRHFGRGFGKAA